MKNIQTIIAALFLALAIWQTSKILIKCFLIYCMAMWINKEASYPIAPGSKVSLYKRETVIFAVSWACFWLSIQG